MLAAFGKFEKFVNFHEDAAGFSLLTPFLMDQSSSNFQHLGSMPMLMAFSNFILIDAIDVDRLEFVKKNLKIFFDRPHKISSIVT